MQRVEGFVEVDAPTELVFDRFSDFEGFPRWMRNIREVRRTGRGMAHWVSATALPDVYAEWDAEVTVYEPDRRVVWRSVRGDIHADGEAVFSVTREGTTIVRVVMGFDTPLGRSGAQASRFFGVRLDRQLDEDLERFRRLVEREWEDGSRSRRGRTFAPVMPAHEPRRRRPQEAVRPRREPFDERRALSERGAGREEREDGSRGRRERGEEEYRPRYALTARERELDRRDFDPRVSETFRRRGVDRLMDEPPSGRWGERGRE